MYHTIRNIKGNYRIMIAHNSKGWIIHYLLQEKKQKKFFFFKYSKWEILLQHFDAEEVYAMFDKLTKQSKI